MSDRQEKSIKISSDSFAYLLERFDIPTFTIMIKFPFKRKVWSRVCVCVWGGGGRFQVSLVPMLEQRIGKHTLNSVLKIYY